MKHIKELKLAGSVDDSIKLDRKERRHLGNCVRCRNNFAAFSQVRGSLAATSHQTIAPGPELVPQILAAVAADRDRHVAGRRAVYAGGLAVAAGLTGAVLFGRQKLGKAA